MVRDGLANARIVVKVGSSSLTTTAGGLDRKRLAALADVLAAVRAAGREVVLVSSGAIAAGLAPLGSPPAARPCHPTGRRERRARSCSLPGTPTRSPCTACA